MREDPLQFWWLIFPLIGFGFSFWAIWLKHQRQKAAITQTWRHLMAGAANTIIAIFRQEGMP